MSEITYAFPKLKNVDPSCYIDAYNLVLECSQAHTPRGFTVKLLDMLAGVCPYDQAMAIFLDVNGKPSGKYTIGFNEEWLDTYFDYYLMSGKLPLEVNLIRDVREGSNFEFAQFLDWSTFPKSEFRADYIDAMGLKHSWSFSFFDLNGNYRVVISLDRTRDVPFGGVERDRLKLALPILNNMHRNFFYQGTDARGHTGQSSWSEYKLTARETEIADLLCQGMTVQNISSALFIAVTTTYKHIAHIYEKVGVSSQQELLVKMLNRDKQ